jgi:hypothetical protein
LSESAALEIGPPPVPPVPLPELVPHAIQATCRNAAQPYATLTFVVENKGTARAGASTALFENTYPTTTGVAFSVPALAVGATSAPFTVVVTPDQDGYFGYKILADYGDTVQEQDTSKSVYAAYACPP